MVKDILVRVVVFVATGVLVGSMPLVLAALNDRRTGPIDLPELLSGGEMLIVSVGVVVAAGAELLGGTSGAALKGSRGLQVTLVLLFIVAICASAGYSQVSSATIEDRLTDRTIEAIRKDLESSTSEIRLEVAEILDTQAQGKLVKQVVRSRAGVADGISDSTAGLVMKDLVAWERQVQSESVMWLLLAVISGIAAIVVSETVARG